MEEDSATLMEEHSATLMDEDNLSVLTLRLGYEFQDPELLREALRHPSFSHEHPEAGPHNQRLEFLGDAVLGLVVAETLIRRFPKVREGVLTRWRAALVSARPLARIARRIGLGEFLLLGRGEDTGGGRARASVLSDGLEAVLGAVFLDGGLPAAKQVIDTIMGDRLDRVAADSRLDPKSMVQEQVQSATTEALAYCLVGTAGPDHDKRFEVELRLGDRVIGRGEGTTKKGAEKAAAADALANLQQLQLCEDSP